MESISMESQKIIAFIRTTGEYLQNPPLTSANMDVILDDMLLSETADLTDKNSNLLSNYLHSIYWLLQSFSEFNHTVSKCVDILTKLSNQQNLRKRLVKNLFFIPLCNFLSDAVPKEDTYKLLKLIDQLSVDIALMFLPENIYNTLDMLCMWAINQKGLISAISLQILTNISYKNDNVKFALLKSKHSIELYRHCLNEMDTSIHANKILMIFKSNELKLPSAILKSLTYDVIFGLVQSGDVRALREKVNIFFDARSSIEDGFKSLNSQEFDFGSKFVKYLENAARDTVTGAQLVAEILRFLRLLISHNVPALLEPNITERLTKVAFSWCSIDNAILIYNLDCAQIESIFLLIALVDNSNIIKKDLEKENLIFKEIKNNWDILQELMRSVLKSSANNESTNLHLALVNLMRSCVTKKFLRDHAVKIYEDLDISYIFNLSSSQQNTSSKSMINLKDVFFDSSDTCNLINQRLLILYTAALLIDICQYDSKYLGAIKQMLTHAQVQTILAQMLLSKNEEEGPAVKATVFSVLQSGYLPINEFSEVLNNTYIFDLKMQPIKQIHYPEVNTAMSSSSSLRVRCDEIITKVEDQLYTGKLDDYTEEIVSLYSLRIAQMERSAILAKETLSVQSKTLADLQQQNDSCNIEINRVSRQALMRGKSVTLNKKEIVELKEKIDKLQITIQTIQNQQTMMSAKFNDELRKNEQLRILIKEKDNEKDVLERKHDEDLKKSHYKLRKQEKECSKLVKNIEDLNEEAVKLNQINAELQTNVLEGQDEVNRKNIIIAQRQKDLIEIQKEKEALAGKISALTSNFESFQKILAK